MLKILRAGVVRLWPVIPKKCTEPKSLQELDRLSWIASKCSTALKLIPSRLLLDSSLQLPWHRLWLIQQSITDMRGVCTSLDHRISTSRTMYFSTSDQLVSECRNQETSQLTIMLSQVSLNVPQLRLWIKLLIRLEVFLSALMPKMMNAKTCMWEITWCLDQSMLDSLCMAMSVETPVEDTVATWHTQFMDSRVVSELCSKMLLPKLNALSSLISKLINVITKEHSAGRNQREPLWETWSWSITRREWAPIA